MRGDEGWGRDPRDEREVKLQPSDLELPDRRIGELFLPCFVEDEEPRSPRHAREGRSWIS